MPNILIDISRLFYRRLNGQLATGIDRVSLEYLRHYAGRARATLGLPPFHSVLSQPESDRAYRALLAPEANGRAELGALAARAYLRWWTRPDVGGSVLLNTSHTGLESRRYASSLRRRGARPVFFVHDLIPITHPQHCRRGERDRRRHLERIRNATEGAGIIVPSRYTLDTLTDYCQQAGLRLPPCIVAPLASSLPRPGKEARPLAQPYFVVVGTIEPRKNLALLLEIWRAVVEQRGDAAPRLVLIGQRGWPHPGVSDVLESGALRGYVLERGACSDREIVTWLAHAQALLFPSLLEGYGLPLAEALSLGTPAIVSDLSVFREIAGEIPEYAAPRDARRWTELIEDYARPGSRLRTAQLGRLAAFHAPDWARHFQLVDDFLEML